MAYTFAQLKELQQRAIADLAAQQNALEAAKAQFPVVATRLGNMQTQYGQWATEVNNFDAANPGDAAAQALKAERDLLVAEFATTKLEAEGLDTLVNGA